VLFDDGEACPNIRSLGTVCGRRTLAPQVGGAQPDRDCQQKRSKHGPGVLNIAVLRLSDEAVRLTTGVDSEARLGDHRPP
jgi:hypothetical protein